jgi:hypothetical protein
MELENQSRCAQSDEFDELFDEAFRGAIAAAPSRARSLRMRRHCENHDDQSHIAV